ncbi:putative exo-beta- -glucanase protein [Cladophialophora carrionii]|uniref:Putative exo-beta--glucanase protein n=1 Tax=Cladophialophora carrionii TaxID=86049 RepID=A0A1C1CZ18_9EURO|nr:putative exo-beta- -glucanase protein [Cladophialophora carrionii]
MALSRLVLLALLPIASTLASPLIKRENDVVQGKLGTDGFWNDYDGGRNNYIQYTGDGSSKAGWPSDLSWISFNDMWVANQNIISRSCNRLYDVPNMTFLEIQDLYDSIKLVSQQTRVDHRFILAAVLQETKGCVRAKTSVSPDGTVRNPGILQSFRGNHTCNDDGKVQNPCPKAQILGMLQDGVAGTADGGHGYALDINAQATVDGVEYAQAYYRAARLYNSGAIDPSGDLEKGSATHCYASDIANRLTGWTDAPSACTFDS